MSKLYSFFSGVIIGVSNIIPGISGGTMAVVLGVYGRLIHTLSILLSLNLRAVNQSMCFFFLYICLGATVGIVSASFAIDYLLIHYGQPMSLFFMGTVLSSIIYLFRKENLVVNQFNHCILLLVCIGIGLGIVYLKLCYSTQIESVNPSLLTIYLSLFFASAAMIVPGVSGSLILVLFGTYSWVIQSIKQLDGGAIFSIGVVSVMGFAIVIKAIRYCLHHHYNNTLLAICGLMIGTLPLIYNGFNMHNLLINSVAFLAGLLCVWGSVLVK